MRTTLCCAAIILLFSCKENQLRDKAPQGSKFALLLTKYKPISFDTLNVFSTDNTEDDTFKFKGAKLDSADVALFPHDLARLYGSDGDFFGCYQIIIDSIRIGLITRSPSTYTSSSIKLLILDKVQDSITSVLELAEMVGDAGDSYIKDSWIFKNRSGDLHTFGWIQEGHDNSVDNEKDTTVQNWDTFYLIDLSKKKIDTINENEKDLEIRFNNLLKRKTML